MAETGKKDRRGPSWYAYRFIKAMVRLFYHRVTLHGEELLPEESCIIVGNHAQIHGPISFVLYCPEPKYVWCAGEMMDMKQVPEYAFRDFWSQKPKWTHPFFRVMSYLIAPVAYCIFNNAGCIGVYHDARVIGTFRETVNALKDGANVVIFPEHDAPGNGIVYELQDRFIDVAKLYYRQTGRVLAFVPAYTAPKLKGVYFGKPVRFDPTADIKDERARIAAYLFDGITALARSLPPHTVVPYRNIPKRLYPKNTSEVN